MENYSLCHYFRKNNQEPLIIWDKRSNMLHFKRRASLFVYTTPPETQVLALFLLLALKMTKCFHF